MLTDFLAEALVGGLSERSIDFGYSYRMRCECGAAVVIPAETYAVERCRDALVPCDACDRQVWFGPSVAMPRNDDDEALDSVRLTELAWYHTSTSADWPAPDHDDRIEADLRSHSADSWMISIDRIIEGRTNRALHLGTYEAAIENMLRRMRNQGDATSQFFLYRVRVDVHPDRVNVGFRDENLEAACQLGVAELDEAGLDVIRYLNVHESCGSLSLAVRPACVAPEARAAIPMPGSGQLSAALAQELERFEGRRRSLLEADPVLLNQPDSWETRLLRSERALPLYELWNQAASTLQDRLLNGVSPVVAEDLSDAMRDRADVFSTDLVEFGRMYAEFASLLTAPEAALRALA